MLYNITKIYKALLLAAGIYLLYLIYQFISTKFEYFSSCFLLTNRVDCESLSRCCEWNANIHGIAKCHRKCNAFSNNLEKCTPQFCEIIGDKCMNI